MTISEPFIRRPVATTLLTVAILPLRSRRVRLLPVSPLPQVEFPTISVSAGLPGASPENHGSSVALRSSGSSAVCARYGNDVIELTRVANITLQFDLNRNHRSAARDVQAAINAARGNLPSNLPNNPTTER